MNKNSEVLINRKHLSFPVSYVINSKSHNDINSIFISVKENYMNHTELQNVRGWKGPLWVT